MTISFAWHDYQAQRTLVYRQAHKPLYTLTISLLDIVTVQRLYCKKDCQICVSNKLTERFKPYSLNPLQNRDKNRGQKKKTTTTKRGAQKRLQNFLFFLSFPYLSTRSMYGNGDKYLSDHVPHLLFACSLFRQVSTFLFFPDCQRRSVFVDPKDRQRSPEEESAENYNNSCKK